MFKQICLYNTILLTVFGQAPGGVWNSQFPDCQKTNQAELSRVLKKAFKKTEDYSGRYPSSFLYLYDCMRALCSFFTVIKARSIGRGWWAATHPLFLAATISLQFTY